MKRDDGRRRRGEATRAAILEEARALLHEQGTEFSLDLLARRVGVTKQAVLHHFPAKERLFVELSLQDLARERDAAVAAVAGTTGRDALVAFIRGVFRFYADNLDSFRLLYLRSQLLADPLRWFPAQERAERLYPVTGEMYAAAERAVRAGDPLPAALDARTLVVSAHLATLGHALMHGLTEASGDPMRRPLDDYLETFARTWVRGVWGGAG